MNYENIKLNKGMYKNEKGFSQTLESLDPSRSYSGTELVGLDAYQRQLKRFDIKVNGANSDVVAKFFQTADTAVLFPEYVRRAVTQGMSDANVVDEIIASKSNISSLDYRSISTVQINDWDEHKVPETEIHLNDNLVSMKKRGRLLTASYEAIKFQRIDLLTIALKQIGAYIAKSMLKDAIATLVNAVEVNYGLYISREIEYSDILRVWSMFDDFEMNTLLASPDMASKLLNMREFQNIDYGYSTVSPFGAKIIKTPEVPKNTIVAFDRRFALEMVQAGEISVDYDKLIDANLERAAITLIYGFNKIFPDAVKIVKDDIENG